MDIVRVDLLSFVSQIGKIGAQVGETCGPRAAGLCARDTLELAGDCQRAS
jgi:hypothetical protein